jgi:hypothetical protein
MMPASAVQTKKWFRPNGWFTDRELGIVVNRVLRDDPSKGDMHNRQAITLPRLWEALKDYDLWPLYAIGLIEFIPTVPPAQYITLTLRKLGFSPFTTNLLTIPYVSSPQLITGISAYTETECLPHHQLDSPHMALREIRRTRLRRPAAAAVDAAVSDSTTLVARSGRRQVGNLRVGHSAPIISLRPYVCYLSAYGPRRTNVLHRCNLGRMDFSQLQQRGRTLRLCRPLQR